MFYFTFISNRKDIKNVPLPTCLTPYRFTNNMENRNQADMNQTEVARAYKKRDKN